MATKTWKRSLKHFQSSAAPTNTLRLPQPQSQCPVTYPPTQSPFGGNSGKYPDHPQLEREGKDRIFRMQAHKQAYMKEMQGTVRQHIHHDQETSKKDGAKYHQGHQYCARHPLLRHSVSAIHHIPKEVTALYNESPSKRNFTQGHLPSSGIIYYAVERTLFLYDARTLCTGRVEVDSTFMGRFEMQDILFSITEANFPSPLILSVYRQHVLLFAHPWKISFYAYHLEEAFQDSPRTMRMIDLKQSYHLKMEHKPEMLCSSGLGEIYFLDEEGACHCISTQKTNPINAKIFGRRSNYLGGQKQSVNLITFYARNRKKASNILSHYFSLALLSISRLFRPCSTINRQLIYDPSRKLLFAFIEGCLEGETMQRIIEMYANVNGSLEKVQSIGEQEIINGVEEGVMAINCVENYRIAKICSVPTDSAIDSNLLVFLNCGLRIYLLIGNSTLQFKYYILPPSLKSHTLETVGEAQLEDKVEPIVSAIGPTMSLLLVKDDCNELKCIFLSKEKDSTERQIVSRVRWGTGGNVQTDNVLSAISEECPTHEGKELAGWNSHMGELHEYARQVYFRPTSYLYSTSECIQYMNVLRPIDILFSIVSSCVVDQVSCIPYAFPLISVREVICMLLQIVSDSKGQYWVSRSLEKALKDYSASARKNDRNFNQFLLEQHIEAQQVTLLRAVDFPADLRGRVISIMIKYGKQGQHYTREDVGGDHKTRKESSIAMKLLIGSMRDVVSRSQRAGVLLYISRVVHPIWDADLNAIKKNSRVVLRKLNSLKLVVMKEFKDDKEAVGFIEQLEQLLIMAQTITQFPSCTYSEALLRPKEFFEEPLFKEATYCYQDPQTAVLKWKEQFPLYVSLDLQRSIHLAQDAKEMKDKEIIEILKMHDQIPQYLLDYFQEEKQVNAVFAQKEAQTGKLEILSGDEYLKEAYQLMETLDSDSSPISKKDLILQLIQQNLDYYKKEVKHPANFSDAQQFKRIEAQSNQFRNCIHIQGLILDAYKHAPNPAPEIVKILNTEIMSKQILRESIRDLECVQLQAVYEQHFGTSATMEKAIKEVVTDTYEKCLADRMSTNQMFTIVIDYIYGHSRKALPAKLFLKLFTSETLPEIINYQNIKKAILNFNAHGYLSPNLYVIGSHLSHLGADVREIANYYSALLREKQKEVPFTLRPDYLYSWLSYFEIVDAYAERERNSFMRHTEQILEEIQRTGLMEKDLLEGIKRCLNQISRGKDKRKK